ncbi:MAG: hypoxanthine-guanine phosphoribosyltransferase [Thermodesulfobacteriota bacterium]|nr:MAG: hypoxanthine-guanine phosphoribosyltransferase [Thermodesulfobacteriota bacterium]
MANEIKGRKLNLLIKSPEIKQKVHDLGKQITNDYQNKNLLIIGILKGSFIFLADLIRSIDINTEIDFIRISSYKNEMTPGNVELITDLGVPIKDRDVLLVEDLLDNGGTLNFIREKILSNQPASFKTCVLLNKKKTRQFDIRIDYIGFQIDDKFVVGYGTDFAEEGRNLPDIYVVE